MEDDKKNECMKSDSLVNEVDKVLWFPTFITQLTRQGYNEPIFSAVRTLPYYEQQMVLRELEQSIQKQIMQLTEDEQKTIKTKMECPQKTRLIAVEMHNKSHGYHMWQELYSDEPTAAIGLANALNTKSPKYKILYSYQPHHFTVDECRYIIQKRGEQIWDSYCTYSIIVFDTFINRCSFTSSESTSKP